MPKFIHEKMFGDLTEPIAKFDKEFYFLSNFYEQPVMFEGVVYPTSEHAYQAAKSVDSTIRKQIQQCKTPGYAKRMGKSIKLRPDWEQIKLDVMEEIVREKFKNDILKVKLIATNPVELIEGNYWKDTFWGVYNNKGKNHLGRILMKIREELVEQSKYIWPNELFDSE